MQEINYMSQHYMSSTVLNPAVDYATSNTPITFFQSMFVTA